MMTAIDLPDPFDVPGLIDRYLAGEVTASERVVVDAWAAADLAHRAVLAHARMVCIETRRPMAARDVERALTAVIARVESVRKPVVPPMVHQPTVARSTARMWRMPLMIAVACAALFVVAGVLPWMQRHVNHGTVPVATQEYVTARGERARVTLPDGSTALLGPESRVRFASARSAGRSVDVSGAVLFIVRASSASPFIVRVRDASVRVLGTTFAVRQYDDDVQARIVVTEGRVAVAGDEPTANAHAPDSHFAVLNAGDAATVTGDTVRVQRDVRVTIETAWAQGQLNFSSMPLRDVVREINRTYAVDVRIASAALGARMVTGEVSGSMRAIDAVQMLAGILGVRVERRGSTLTLTE